MIIELVLCEQEALLMKEELKIKWMCNKEVTVRTSFFFYLRQFNEKRRSTARCSNMLMLLLTAMFGVRRFD